MALLFIFSLIQITFKDPTERIKSNDNVTVNNV